jgi:hypothetical protein
MNLRAAHAAALGLLCLQSAHAGPEDYVFTPMVDRGETELDFKSGSQDSHPRKTVGTLGLGYGVNDWWFTEAYLKYAKEGGDGFDYDAFEWENKFQLTETGKYPVEVGFINEIEVPKDRDEGIELKVGPLFQTDVSKVQLNGNILFERTFDADTPSSTEIGYQWQVKYRLQPVFEFGFQGFGEMGKWNDWEPADEQSHKGGPAIFGKKRLNQKTAINYNAAWLFGLTDGAPDNTIRLQVEFEF